MVPGPGNGLNITPPPPLGWGHGLVLRRRALGEADLALDVFFVRRGILECTVRRGAFASTPQKAALEPPALTFFRFQWLSGEKVRGDSWSTVALFPRARKHPLLALEVCHSLSSYLPRGWWESSLFRTALRALQNLEKDIPPREVQLFFRLGFLTATGHSPEQLLPRRFPLKTALHRPQSKERKILEKVTEELWMKTMRSPLFQGKRAFPLP